YLFHARRVDRVGHEAQRLGTVADQDSGGRGVPSQRDVEQVVIFALFPRPDPDEYDGFAFAAVDQRAFGPQIDLDFRDIAEVGPLVELDGAAPIPAGTERIAAGDRAGDLPDEISNHAQARLLLIEPLLRAVGGRQRQLIMPAVVIDGDARGRRVVFAAGQLQVVRPCRAGDLSLARHRFAVVAESEDRDRHVRLRLALRVRELPGQLL